MESNLQKYLYGLIFWIGLLTFSPANSYAQCPAFTSITPVAITCNGANDGKIIVKLQNTTVYNIGLFQEVNGIFIPVSTANNQVTTTYTFLNLSPSNKYTILVSFPMANMPPPPCDAFLVSGSITVIEPVVLTPVMGADVTICDGGSTILSASGGDTYSWSPIQGLNDPNIANPIASPTNTTNYTVIITKNGCVGMGTQKVTVTPAPVITFDLNPDKYCVTLTDVPLAAEPVGGAFTGTGVTGTSFNPSVAGVGFHTITYHYTENNCSVTKDQNVEVTPEPVPDIVGLDSVYCQSHPNVAMTGIPAGGSFMGPGVFFDVFSPSNAGVGTHEIFYEYFENGCLVITSKIVKVKPDPVVDIVGLTGGPYCVESSPVVMQPTPVGGTLSGNGVVGNTFDPAVAGVGIHTITYSYPSNGCILTKNIDVEVKNSITPVSITNLDPKYCVSAMPVILIGDPVGGTFAGNGMTGDQFDPSQAGIGIHTITYTYDDGNCLMTVSKNVEVTPTPIADIVGLGASYCQDNAVVNLVGSPVGGVFSGNGVVGNTFDPNIAGVGIHTITYTYNQDNCTVAKNQDVEVKAVPVVDFTGLAPTYCQADAAVMLTGNPLGGVFSGNGITGNAFDPAVAGVGIHTITYTYMQNGCQSSKNYDVEVKATPIVSIDPAGGPYCQSAPAIALVGNPVGGNFSGNGIVGNTFDPSIAGVGNHTITYTYMQNGCSASTTIQIAVTAQPVLTINGLNAQYCHNAAVANLSGFPVGGTFSGNGIAGNNFDPVAAGIGIHTITYQYAENGCMVSTNQDVEVVFCDPCLGVTITADLNIIQPITCGDQGNLTVNNVVSGTLPYSYSVDGITFQPSNTFNNLTSGNYTLTIKDANNCSNTFPFVINTINPIAADVPIVLPVSCNGGSDGSIEAVNVIGGSGNYLYSIDGIIFQASPIFSNLTAGAYTLTIKDDGACTLSIPVDIIQPAIITADVVVATPAMCGGNDGSITINNVLGGNGGYEFSLNNGLYDVQNVFTNLSEGAYQVNIKDNKGCSITMNVNITTPNNLNIDVAATSPTCNGNVDGMITLQNPSGGSGNYEYSLDNNNYQAGLVFNLLAPGNYTVYMKDLTSNCIKTFPITINPVPSLTASLDVIQPNACTNTLGQINVTNAAGGTAPYLYSLDNVIFQNSNSFANLTAGGYTIYIKDANNCNISIQTNLSLVNALQVNNTQLIHPTCQNATDGEIVFTNVTGGVPPYAFSIDNGVTYQAAGIFKNLAAGFHTVQVKDAGNCTAVVVYALIAPQIVDFNAVQLQAATCASANGSAEIQNVSGGIGPYLYSKDGINYQNSPIFNSLSAGNYTMYVKDAGSPNCVSTKLLAIDGAQAITYAITKKDIICDNPIAAIEISNIQGGDKPYTIQIKGNNLDQSINTNQDYYTFSDLQVGSYTITVTDINNCQVKDTTLTIVQPAALTAQATATLSRLDEPTGTITVKEIQGGVKPYQVSIDEGQNFTPVEGNIITLSQIAIGNYNVIVSDSNNCAIQLQLQVGESTFIIPNIFTPNGDGANDAFFVRNLPAQGSSLKIANRWGEIVYKNANYQNDWKGDNLPDGVYYYTLIIPEMGNFSGWVQIWR